MVNFDLDIGSLYGAFQAYARSVFAELIPMGEEARWYGLYSITDKVYSLRFTLYYIHSLLPSWKQADAFSLVLIVPRTSHSRLDRRRNRKHSLCVLFLVRNDPDGRLAFIGRRCDSRKTRCSSVLDVRIK